MKTILRLCLIGVTLTVLLALGGCSDTNSPTNPADGRLFPLDAGRWWVFSRATLDDNGQYTSAIQFDSAYVSGSSVIQGIPSYQLSTRRAGSATPTVTEYGTDGQRVYAYVGANLPLVGTLVRRWGVIADPNIQAWTLWDTTLADVPLPQGLDLPIPLPPDAMLGIKVRFRGTRGAESTQRVSLRTVLMREYTVNQEVILQVKGRVGNFPITIDIGTITSGTIYGFAPGVGLCLQENIPTAVTGIIAGIISVPPIGEREQSKLLRFNLP